MQSNDIESECKEIIEEIIERYASVSNMGLAVRFVNKLDGVNVDENGNLQEVATPEKVGEVINKIFGIAGSIAIKFTRDTLNNRDVSQEILEEVPDKFH